MPIPERHKTAPSRVAARQRVCSAEDSALRHNSVTFEWTPNALSVFKMNAHDGHVELSRRPRIVTFRV